MQTRNGFLALLLAGGLGLASGARGQDAPPPAGTDHPVPLIAALPVAGGTPVVRGQDYSPPDPQFPLPLYSNRPGAGGLYVAAEFIYFQQTNPIKHQIIGVRGLFDADGSINAAIGRPNRPPGTFIGSGRTALSADDIGQLSYEPGFNAAIGWRLRNGTAFEFAWMHINEAKYHAVAGVEPFAFRVDRSLADTFLTAPVFNFPQQMAGPPIKMAVGNPGAAFGIWDAASEMTLKFTQRFDQYELNIRVPIDQTDDNRVYGLLGPRVIHMWENFQWYTISRDTAGNASAADGAVYSNITSNNLWGVHIGCGDECRFGDTPIGTFSGSLDLQAALFCDFATLISRYDRLDFQYAMKRARRQSALVPELQANVNLWYYPIEGVQLRFGYSAMAFFDTFGSPNPVNFNFGGVDATYEHMFRWFNGMNAGLALIF